MLNMEKQSESPCIQVASPATEVCMFCSAIMICKNQYQHVANNGGC